MKKFLNFPEKQIVVVCFGTPLVSGDALGPKVGTLLQNWNLPCFVYGTEDRPVTATNMKEYIIITDSTTTINSSGDNDSIESSVYNFLFSDIHYFLRCYFSCCKLVC